MYEQFKELLPNVASEPISCKYNFIASKMHNLMIISPVLLKEEKNVAKLAHEQAILKQVAINNDKKLKNIMACYNQFVNTISEHFVKWDLHLAGAQ